MELTKKSIAKIATAENLEVQVSEVLWEALGLTRRLLQI
jgi:hypothetical protein